MRSTPPLSPLSSSPRLIIGAALIIALQIVLLYAGFHNAPSCSTATTPTSPTTSTSTLTSDVIERLNNHTCYQPGVKGQLDPDAIATFGIAPDRELWLSYDSQRRTRRHIDTVVRSYRQYAASVAFVVITTDCTIMDMALGMGLAAIRPESGTDVGDLTYNHAFALVQKYAKTEFVGFALGDVIFGAGLVESVQALVRARHDRRWGDVFAAATIYDLDDNDVPLEAMPIGSAGDDDGAHGRFLALARAKAVRGLDISSDVFLWNRDWSASWIDRPPFVFGGDGFDSWMVGWVQARKATVTIDLSATLEIFRIRRRFQVWPGQRFQIESMLNSGVFMDKGLQGDCDLTHLRWMSDRDRSVFEEGIVNIVDRQSSD